jgi:hypothetical protein
MRSIGIFGGNRLRVSVSVFQRSLLVRAALAAISCFVSGAPALGQYSSVRLDAVEPSAFFLMGSAVTIRNLTYQRVSSQLQEFAWAIQCRH